MTPEKTALTTVASLMALAARTAPKGKGVDTIIIRVLTGKEISALATRLSDLGETQGIGFFLRDAKNISACDACVLIGAQGDTITGINCGACGYTTCADMTKECKKRKNKKTTPFSGPNCAIRMADLGIALGSAVKTAQIHNADNRIMYSGGVAAIDLGLMGKDCTVAYAIPLSATGKNIFFDRS
ncbi:MAG: ferredoxin domain-containing protein [Methanoregula sp.]